MLQRIILLLVSFSLVIGNNTGSPASLLFVDSDPLANLSGLDTLQQPESMTLNDVRDVVKHNMGLLQDDMTGKAQKMQVIQQYGNSNALKNKFLNYLFIIETSNDINSENKMFQQKLNVQGQTTLQLDICPLEDNKKCIHDKFYNIKSDGSVSQQLQKNYGNDHRDLIYYYSTEFQNKNLMTNYSLGVVVNEENAVELLEMQNNNVWKINNNLQSCINNYFQGQYSYDAQDRSILQKSTGKTLQVSIQQEYYMKEFLKDICGIVKISTLIRREKLPELFTFHLTSLGQFEALLKEDEKEFVTDMLANSIGQFREAVQKYFDQDEISGQVMFLKYVGQAEGLDSVIQAESELQIETNILLEKRILMTTTLKADPVVTAPVYWLNMSSTNYQIYLGTLIGLAFLLVYVLLALFNMENQKDTLIYAKFLVKDGEDH